MTPEHLLVDGYNVINVWPELRGLGNPERHYLHNLPGCAIIQVV
jgi:predicted RNA-binding protein with PIN domain